MAMKMAFMAIVPDADPDKHRSVLSTEFVEMVIQFVANMDQALDKAEQLVGEGCGVIELCGGFGHSMTGRIADAVRGRASVGSVRFDVFPGLGKSSDEIFSG